METKLLPHDINSEEAVLGSLLIGGDSGNITLSSDDFYSDQCRLVYQACLNVQKRGASINQVTVGQELSSTGHLEAAGGDSYLSAMIASCPTHLDLVYYADIVQRLSLSRRLVAGGRDIEVIGYKASADISKSLNEADEILVDIRKHGVPSPVVTPRNRAELMGERYRMLAEVEGGVAIKTGIYDVDYHLGGGFYNGDLIIVGARPSMGKTSFLQFIANQVSINTNVLFCSGEMSIEAVSDRDVAGIVGKPINEVRRGGYGEDMESQIVNALGELDLLNVYYYEDIPLTTDKILQQGIAMQLRHGMGLLVIDYLGMLDDEYGRTTYDRISYISRKLKQLARRLDVPVLVAHQLNRALEGRSDKRPQLFDLRESGRLEEDADVVLFLYREDYYYTQDEWDRGYRNGNDFYSSYPEGVVEILVAKQRQGSANLTIKTLFNKTKQRYNNMVRDNKRAEQKTG